MTDITIQTSTQKISGWTDMRLTRGIERMPSDFAITCTERFPGTLDIVLFPGQPIQVFLGTQLVLTGYIDRYSSNLSPARHEVTINGRSKCEDLVDCSAGINKDLSWFGGYVGNQTLQALATQLCAPFGITVSNPTGDPGPVLPVFFVNFGETVFEVLEKCARYAGFLLYDDVNGNLVMARAVNQPSMASGFVEGQNMQVESSTYTMDQRYSDYLVVWSSTTSLRDVSQSLGADQPAMDGIHGETHDAGVPRFRPLAIVSDQFIDGQDVGGRRAIWERNRRWGRSQAIRFTTDKWFDSAGMPWSPNYFANLSCPMVKVVPTNGRPWVISEVTYRINAKTGTTADIVMMPPEAFSIEPTALVPYDVDVTQQLSNLDSSIANKPDGESTFPTFGASNGAS